MENNDIELNILLNNCPDTVYYQSIGCTKNHIIHFLRPPNNPNERSCSSGEKCIGINFPYDENEKNPLREFLTPEEISNNENDDNNNTHPKVQRFCYLCRISYIQNTICTTNTGLLSKQNNNNNNNNTKKQEVPIILFDQYLQMFVQFDKNNEIK